MKEKDGALVGGVRSAYRISVENLKGSDHTGGLH
jgi:hypothetical protein